MIPYHENFQQSLDNISKLSRTPEVMQQAILFNLRSFDSSGFKNSDRDKFNNLITLIENISSNNLQDEYKIIYNQMCILAVSALSATLEKYFINYATSNWKRYKSNPKQIKLDLVDIAKYNLNLNNALGKIIIDGDNSINFQDLGSTLRTFKAYFDRSISVEIKTMSKVIFYQQCRHLLAHRNGEVDDVFLSRVADHNIKNYSLGDKVELGRDDWDNICVGFKEFVEAVIPKAVVFEDEGKVYYLAEKLED